ncbi:hypothetical protein [Bosea sp. (in: a-proteobacteria)]|jgi:hypothetical protein|uniref:hypothetical protein n=1 Tax=Bosea sp. (in: a-proteobacteria) TaxID=1871050 RepID=UPI003F72008D
MARPVGRSVALVLGALLAPVVLVLAPRDRASVIVLAASSAGAAEAVTLAEGAILARFGEFGLVARSDEPGFAARLYGAGAMLVIDGAGRGGCLPQSQPS